MSISKEIISIIDVLCQKFGLAIDWTSETILPQIQSVFEHLVQYEIFSSWFWIGFTLLFVIAFSILLAVSCAKCDSDLISAMLLLVIVAIVAFLIVTGVQGHDIVTAIYFPEKAIYDYLLELSQGLRP